MKVNLKKEILSRLASMEHVRNAQYTLKTPECYTRNRNVAKAITAIVCAITDHR